MRHKERPMPERPRLDPPEDFIPFAVCIMEPGQSPPPSHRTFALEPPVLRVYAEHRVEAHNRCPGHWPTEVNRFGDGWCRCGARMWSPWWVADGLYGLASALSGVKVLPLDSTFDGIDDAFDGTASWIAEAERIWTTKVVGS